MSLNPSTPIVPEELTGVMWRKSSRSANAGGNCVEVGAVPWRKSSRSQGGGANCVELGPVGGGTERVAVRDSKDPAGPAFVFDAPQWTAFLAAVKSGAVGHP
jgi:hypothetical protein